MKGALVQTPRALEPNTAQGNNRQKGTVADRLRTTTPDFADELKTTTPDFADGLKTTTPDLSLPHPLSIFILYIRGSE